MTKEEKYKEALLEARAVLEPCLKYSNGKVREALDSIDKELKSFESEDEKIKKTIRQLLETARDAHSNTSLAKPFIDALAWLEKQKENPKSADSIQSNCTSDAKCEDRWHKVSDSLPDNGRLVLANDCLGNTLLARYDGEGNWEVSVYDNEDYYCRNTITKWCEIPSEKQKEQKPVSISCGHENDAEWTEEDENVYESIQTILLAEARFVEERKWFDSIKARIRSVCWSEEDEKKITFLERLIRYNVPEGQYGWADGHKSGFITKSEAISKLKSLRPQYHGDVTMTEAYKMGLEAGKASSWKPSEEQMKALEAATVRYQSTGLESLFEELKKL